MSWVDLLSGGCEGYADHLRLERVSVTEDAGRMLVSLLSSSLVMEEEYFAIKKCLQNRFPETRVSLRVASPALAMEFVNDPGAYSKFLTACLTRGNPGVAAMLNACVWQAEEGRLTLIAESEANKAVFAQLNIAGRTERLLWDVFRLRAAVMLLDRGAVDEQAQRLAALRESAESIQKSAQKAAPPPRQTTSSVPPSGQIMGGRITSAPTPMREVTAESEKVTVMGEVLSAEAIDTRAGDSKILTFLLADDDGAVFCKAFLGGRRRGGEDQAEPAKDERKRRESIDAICQAIKPGMYLKVRGSCQPDQYTGDFCLRPADINAAHKPKREDTAHDKRVELHLHTQMSGMDGLASAETLIKQAAEWGHPAIAITDHGVTQAFPEAFAAAKKHNIQLLPGMEAYLCDEAVIVTNPTERSLDGEMVVLDFETTGLSAERDRVIEIGAVRIANGQVMEEYGRMVNPGIPIPPAASKINNITDVMVKDAPTFAQLADEFAAFLGDSPIVAHNAPFDSAFLRAEFKRIGVERRSCVVDTLALSRKVYPRQRSHTLKALCKALGISLKDAHRAVHDARATAKVLNAMLAALKADGSRTIADLNNLPGGRTLSHSFHATILAISQTGMTNLNRLVSDAHLRYFNSGRPHIPRSLLQANREGLLIGSACEAGELFRAVLDGKDDEALRRIASFYDFLEIMPIGNNAFLVREGRVKDDDGLRDLNRKVFETGGAAGIPVTATGDVHFLNPEDARLRAVLMANKGFSDADEQAPLYFKTTSEMLEEFSYLGDENARAVVIDNPRAIAARAEKMRLFPDHPEGKQTFQPVWERAAKDIETMSYENAKARYGDPLPEIIDARLKKELGAIIGYGFATLYSIAQKLVAQSIADGYLVGSRGSVGSSFVATMCGITEVNPLPPHYVCPACKHGEFDARKIAPTGVDLPPRDCPECGAPMLRDGFDIPFEVFLGFKGDKVPDIDLNFSGVYQPRAHKNVELLFGEGYVFRAGTIGTLAEKTALFIVNKYCEARGLTMTLAEKTRLALGCVGVKRTTGQHPGGMVVLPKGYDIYQFTAVQHPADDTQSNTVTTHYDFSSMHDVLVKLDILGHDDPTMIRMLEELTGVSARSIQLNDPGVMALFTSTESLGVDPYELGSVVGTYGIPEFGTHFVRQMLMETKPHSMDELVRISGLSHGTDVWSKNAQDLIEKGIAQLRQCICTREDIMNYLIDCGVPTKIAFDTMESVRKGKGLTDDMEQAMRDASVPEWIMGSCRKIKYMFPKGHAVAYVTMALRIGYFKVYHPIAYYCAYFTIRAVGFDALCMALPPHGLREKIAELNERGRDLTAKDKDQITMLEIALEMNLRGIRFAPVDLYASHADTFTIVSEGGAEIRPPLNALPGLGLSAAQSICAERSERPFLSVEDLRLRTRLSAAIIEMLRAQGCLSGLPETSQLTFFA